jgi:lysophospholipase L1-like esterase
VIYLALGDSISIDDYTGVEGGGAASQLARLVRADPFVDLTSDGNTTEGVLRDLASVHVIPEMVTLTAGGNDFLMAAFWGANPQTHEGMEDLVERPLRNLGLIADRVATYGCPVIFNTIYDPTDGDDSLGNQLGLPSSFRPAYNRLNEGIRSLAYNRGFLLSDLEALFRGHGIGVSNSWIVRGIEPNLGGATAIARHWLGLLEQHGS